MKFRTGLLFFLFLSLTIVSMLGNSSCANIVPPLGGPRDTLPPRLISVVPRDNSLNFVIKDVKNNKIVFNFDEYIDPKDVRTELIVSPVPKLEPIVNAKLRTLTVRLKDTLQPNTTYSLDFGKAIRDVNEGNILKNFTYTFSTGKYLDSMEFSGNVIVAETGKVDSTLIVILHKSLDDSAVVKERPRYMTRVDTTGRFRFRHLEPGTYAVYSMKDEGGTRRYISKGQLFGFADSPVIIHQGTPSVSLYVFTEKADVKPSSKSSTGSKPGQAAKQTDKEKEKDKRLQFQTNLSNGEFDVLDTFRILFPNPLKEFETSRIRFTDEHFKDISERDYHFERDTTYKKYSLFYNWPTNTKYHLILAKDFAQDSAGRKLLKIDTLSFHTKKDIEYGEVRVRITNLDLSRNPVLLMIQQDVVKFSYAFKGSKEFRKTLFAPGEYELRILYDANKNGIWDSGEFFGKHLQPEKVVPIRKKLTVKANWDNDWDYTL